MTQTATEGVQFFVPGTPKAQPRLRAFYDKHIGQARVYDAGTAEGWKGQVALASRAFKPLSPMAGPLYVSIRFQMPRPKSHYRTGKHAGELKPDAPYWHTGKPDRDNLEKAVLDALTELGFWQDDGQVCAGPVEKVYSQSPGANIEIETIKVTQ